MTTFANASFQSKNFSDSVLHDFDFKKKLRIKNENLFEGFKKEKYYLHLSN